jgi:23S rRNA (adenine2030-N6)-methyltransferase
MQYRHVFHAGNFADVHKHIALLQLIEALKKKAKGFLYLDTHAGEGLYDLAGEDARQSAESEAGIVRLQQAMASTPGVTDASIRHYLDVIARLRAQHGGRPLYPGSPLLAAATLRDVDAAICVESEAPVARALQRALASTAATQATAPRVLNSDGYRELKAQLPPPTRRGLVLIDPPYESREEEQQVATALADGLLRFETGVFAVWYPIKKERDSDLWLARVTRGITRPVFAAEFCLHVPDNTAALNGSGLLVVNPPWGFDTGAHAWQVQLEELLHARGGSRVRWLVRETT